jgi:deoxyribose-phosphate aldolase
VIQFFNIGSHTQRREGIKDSKRVASLQKFVGIAFMQCSGDEQHNVVDHVRVSGAYRQTSAQSRRERFGESVRDVVKELAERFNGIGPQEVELIDENLGRLLSNGGGGDGGGFVGEKVAVVGRRQLSPEVCRCSVRMKLVFLGAYGRTFQCLALCEVGVVSLGEEARLVASDDGLEKTGGNLDGERSQTRIAGETPGRLTLKKRASIVAPDCVLFAWFPTADSVFSRPCRSLSTNLIFSRTMDSKTIELAIEKATEHIAAHPLPAGIPSVPLDQKLVAGHIDHTLLKPDATPAQITVLCEEAKRHSFKVNALRRPTGHPFMLIQSCCVNSHHIPLVTSLLSGSSSIPCAVVGFPLGACTTSTKAFETTEAIKAGAKEIDMVINVGLLKSGDLVGVYNDISSVISAAAGTPVKVIIETSLLTKEEKISASVIAALAGAAYVKTNTGFNGGGATVEDVELMYQAVAFKKGTVKVKASGGIRSFECVKFQLLAFFGLTPPQGCRLHVAWWSRQARDVVRCFDRHWRRYSGRCILEWPVSPSSLLYNNVSLLGARLVYVRHAK